MSALSVHLDARRLQDRPLGGVGRALAGLVPELARRCDVTLVTDGHRPSPDEPVRTVDLRSLRGLPEVLWLQGPARRWARAHPALFHGTFNALPWGLRGPSVVTIYDLSFEVHPEDFGWAKRRVFQVQARSAARRAARVITASRFSAHELTEHYGVDPERVAVIPLAVDPVFSPERERPADDGARPYVVALGGARRRGLEVAIAAWRSVRATGIDVDLCTLGHAGPAEPHLRPLGRLDDDEWASVLAGASALVYPTRYEGFGLPALEAAASGTPVVCARVASLPEVLGSAAAWCDEPTVDQIAEQLRSVLTDLDRATHLRAAGLERAAAAPTWAQVAAAHLEVYRSAIDG